MWWGLVFLFPHIRVATLGTMSPDQLFAYDLVLYVLPSFGLAIAPRSFVPVLVTVVALWTAGLTCRLLYEGWNLGVGGWGGMLMGLSVLGQLCAAATIVTGRFPRAFLVAGPLRFQVSQDSKRWQHFAKTAAQVVGFWGFFLLVLPSLIWEFENRSGMYIREFRQPWLAGAGWVLFGLLSILGLWSAFTMAKLGKGTPLPSKSAQLLVVDGPYRFVRNPMAVAGIGQGVAVGLIMTSWLVVLYALIGSVAWNTIARPLEEADLKARFGADFESYKQSVRCWVPRW